MKHLLSTILSLLGLSLVVLPAQAAPSSLTIVSNYGTSSVSLFNFQNSSPTVTTPSTSTAPRASVINRQLTKFYIAAYTSVDVFDADTLAYITSIPVDGGAATMVRLDNGDKLYVANRNAGTVSVIDMLTDTVTNTITVGTLPYPMLFSQNFSKLYVGNQASNTISVIDLASETVTSTITLPVSGAVQAMVASPNRSVIYATQPNADGNVFVINTISDTVTKTILVGSRPFGLTVLGNGSKLYVTNRADSTVSVIDCASETVNNTITIPGGITGNIQNLSYIEAHPNGTAVYVTSFIAGTFNVIDTSTETVSNSLNIGIGARNIRLTAGGGRAIVLNSNTNKVYVILTGSLSVQNVVDTGVTPLNVTVQGQRYIGSF